jgi:hypothetical protein
MPGPSELLSESRRKSIVYEEPQGGAESSGISLSLTATAA